MAYLYLENKTFINAHLLKAGLAEVDEGVEFRYKEKFLNILHI
jgi:site-specific DNA-methyltransferase (adenine-specific)